MHRSLILLLVLLCALEASIIHKRHKAIRVRVLRASEIQKTRLADGTKFETFVEKGEIPALPIEEEEEADDLNDPRIGHLDKDGGIAVPVDSHGKVLKGYEYLLKPITIDLDFNDEKGYKIGPAGDYFDLPAGSRGGLGQTDYKPYPNNQDMSPKQEFLPGEQETVGDEYDDVASEPREPLPNVPDLPKPDYTDSGEDDEDLKAMADLGADDEQGLDGEAVPRRPDEVIYPNPNIEIPVSQDDVNESSKTMDEVEQETEIRGDEESGGRGVDIPMNGLLSTDETTGGWEEEGEVLEREDGLPPNGSPIEKADEELTDEDMEDLAKDLGKEVFDNVMNKAKDFGWNNEESSVNEDDLVDPNSINSKGEIPSDAEESEGEVVVAGDNDGVVLPEQEELTDEELARIEAESKKPVEPVAPAVPPPRTNVRGGRIGSGVQPDSATQYNILIQFFLVSLAFLIL